jgi:hypothetical protein
VQKEADMKETNVRRLVIGETQLVRVEAALTGF